ncbi:PREDICTED: fibrillin-3-like [Branchiostoma belcheri]|uniref:Fibrillin-3-like n=1 Tax=Branchiostoma belcheri TaxID=7741 RepID=A0A6P5A0V0_BRABE|nr:PREDICTED: fibrillin-3-like [Branchiostoma belcheri]
MVKVKVPSEYMGQMCGLCGNNNGVRSDDFMLPDGEITNSRKTFANSWYIDTRNVTCPDPPPGHCEEHIRTAAEAACQILKDTDGPFAVCHNTEDPEPFFQSCVIDMCAWGISTTALCQNLETYADECREVGVAPFAWRTDDRCPLDCQPDSTYSICTTPCPATCPNPNAPKQCTESCVEGCECNPGYLLSGQNCVLEEQCGCISDYGRYFMLGEQWRENGFDCVCEEGNVMACESVTAIMPIYIPCDEAAETTVCYAWGDPHYHMFDGDEHHFQGPCRYTLAKDQGTSCDFIVEAQNQPITSAPHLSFVRDVYVEAYGLTVGLHQGKLVTVDGELHSLPFSKALNKIQVYLSGLFVYVWLVAVPDDYSGSMCGLCGNFNGFSGDDFMTPDGTIVADVNIFGNSWLTDNETCPDDPPTDPPDGCSDALKAAAEAECGVLTDDPGPFASCHGRLDPQRFFDTCVFDLCGLGGDTRGLCQNLEAYAEACVQAGGARFSWRTPDRCPLNCGGNSTFSTCASLCPATCLNPTASEKCDRNCTEGCECDEGFLLSGQTCVLESQCGCTGDEGRYFVLGERWGREGETCVCEMGGNITCEACSEDDGHELVLVNGVLECLCVEDRCNECLSDPCQNGSCIDRVNGYTCDCFAGYEGVHCETDIDECAVSSDNCDSDATCTNTPGSFTCACNSGYQGDGRSCVDMDECALGTDDCDSDATCTNTPGSFTCACNSGYQGDGRSCVDIDECALGTDDCDGNATCTNTPGSFTCACNSGYQGDGRSCVDIDECAVNTDDCNGNATCTNTPGSFTCACNSGYQGDGRSCVDIDECAMGTDDCDSEATCTNTPGTFTCACNSGYHGDGRSCVDIDECAEDTDDCDSDATCTNTPGTFTCACNSGYQGDGRSCVDMDECALGTDDCDSDATCTNTPGSFTCACNSGYQGDGRSCVDIDECAMGTDDCDGNATCTNTPGSFTCACNSGYWGDGRSCDTDNLVIAPPRWVLQYLQDASAPNTGLQLPEIRDFDPSRGLPDQLPRTFIQNIQGRKIRDELRQTIDVSVFRDGYWIDLEISAD